MALQGDEDTVTKASATDTFPSVCQENEEPAMPWAPGRGQTQPHLRWAMLVTLVPCGSTWWGSPFLVTCCCSACSMWFGYQPYECAGTGTSLWKWVECHLARKYEVVKHCSELIIESSVSGFSENSRLLLSLPFTVKHILHIGTLVLMFSCCSQTAEWVSNSIYMSLRKPVETSPSDALVRLFGSHRTGIFNLFPCCQRSILSS